MSNNDDVMNANGIEIGIDESQRTPNEAILNPQDAYAKGDVEASIAAHDARVKLAPEDHGGAASGFIKSIVFGGLDGIITTFATVAAVAGSGLPVEVLILMGFANLIGDGISMGCGDYLSSKAEMDHVFSERRREQWEFDNYPQGEKQEMIELYVKEGFDREDAETIINTYTKKPEYAKAFINHMMVVELGYMVPDEDENPAKDGLVTFLSFLSFGSVPLWIYVIFYAAGAGGDSTVMFSVSCVSTAVTLFLLGMFKARLTRDSPFKSGGLILSNGALAAAAAYLVGWGLDQTLGASTSQC